MDITKLSAKPQLVKITLDDEAIVAKYSEPIDFYTWDRQPMDTFLKMASAGVNDEAKLIDTLRTMILDEKGKQVISGDNMLPVDILVAAMQKLSENLGK
tara:strand:+ start:3133 stop:3429 length:297 start_codon:yes stop_codon:yes gene_type:complete